MELYEKIPNIDSIYYEKPKMYDKISLAINEAENRAISSFYVTMQIYKGLMSIGDFTSVINAITLLSNNVLQYSNIIPEFRKHTLFVSNYFDILELKSDIYDKNDTTNIACDKVNDIKLESITFSYPNKRNAVNMLSLYARRGEKIALDQF